MNKKVLLGLSGGVDSTVAAALLKGEGYDVTGYFFDITGNNTSEFNEAKKTAETLNIPLIHEDVSHRFQNIVIKNFIDEYVKGRTPNPCIICNPLVKFYYLLNNADKIGAHYIATGHYSSIEKSREGNFYIKMGNSHSKDQSYMLYRLGQNVLSRLLLPLGTMSSKDETREIARTVNVSNSEKKDSQEICFVPKNESYTKYLADLGIKSKTGYFVSKEGEVLGEHKGILNYTIGQRKGLGIALGKPAFVTNIDYKNNKVTLGDNEDLFTFRVVSTDNFFTGNNIEKYIDSEIYAKVRYSAPLEKIILTKEGNKLISVFSRPQRAVTPGQSIVFYENDLVIGGGFIE